MKYVVFALLAFGLISTGVLAGDDPIAQRQDIMKDNRKALKPLGEMVKGEREFDAAVVASSVETWKHTADSVGDLFPEGSETGGDTEAKSTIWSDRAGFETALADFGEAVDAFAAADPQSTEALKAELGGVTKTCKGCHDNYRVEHEH